MKLNLTRCVNHMREARNGDFNNRDNFPLQLLYDLNIIIYRTPSNNPQYYHLQITIKYNCLTNGQGARWHYVSLSRIKRKGMELHRLANHMS